MKRRTKVKWYKVYAFVHPRHERGRKGNPEGGPCLGPPAVPNPTLYLPEGGSVQKAAVRHYLARLIMGPLPSYLVRTRNYPSG